MKRRSPINTYQDLMEEFYKYGYKLMDINIYKGVNTKVHFIDKDGYIYYSKLSTLREGWIPRKWNASNDYSIHNINLWLKLNNINMTINENAYMNSDVKINFSCTLCQSVIMTTWKEVLHEGRRCNCVQIMNKKIRNHNNFIRKLSEINHKAYSNLIFLVDYIEKHKPTLVITKYGICKIEPKKLLEGSFPTIRSAINKTEYFINQSREKFENIYNYDKTLYIDSSNTKVCIICPKHGEFWQTPSVHLLGNGCPKCSISKFDSHEDYIKYLELNSTCYNNRLIIKILNEYKNTNTILSVITKYGICKITAYDLLKSKEITIRSAINKSNFFANQSKEVHGYRYKYNKVDYKNATTEVCIICPEHGEFLQKPCSHIRGRGCPKCGREKLIGYYNIYRADKNKKEWKNIKAIVYIIKCFNDFEFFYKIGITTNGIKERFSDHRSMPYYYSLEYEIKTNLYDAIHIESSLHKKHLKYRYSPEIYFNGHTECFSKILKEDFD